MPDYVYDVVNDEFKDRLDINSGVIGVRPKLLLSYIEKIFDIPVSMALQIPSSEIGSLTMLEATMLCTLVKICKPKVLFEIGTYLGYTTRLLLDNSNYGKVYSMDLSSESLDSYKIGDIDQDKVLIDDRQNDNYLRKIQSVKGHFYLKDLVQSSKLILLKGDSRFFKFSSIQDYKNVDFVFIDGGHDYDTVKCDFNNALDYTGDSSVIVFHDYDSKIHGDVTKFVNTEVAFNHLVFHIQNTMIAFIVKGRKDFFSK